MNANEGREWQAMFEIVKYYHDKNFKKAAVLFANYINNNDAADVSQFFYNFFFETLNLKGNEKEFVEIRANVKRMIGSAIEYYPFNPHIVYVDRSISKEIKWGDIEHAEKFITSLRESRYGVINLEDFDTDRGRVQACLVLVTDLFCNTIKTVQLPTLSEKAEVLDSGFFRAAKGIPNNKTRYIVKVVNGDKLFHMSAEVFGNLDEDIQKAIFLLRVWLAFAADEREDYYRYLADLENAYPETKRGLLEKFQVLHISNDEYFFFENVDNIVYLTVNLYEMLNFHAEIIIAAIKEYMKDMPQKNLVINLESMYFIKYYTAKKLLSSLNDAGIAVKFINMHYGVVVMLNMVSAHELTI